MFEQSLREMMVRNALLTAPPDAPISRVASSMAERNAGAVVVVDGERTVGIFTERDAVFRVLAKGLRPEDTRLDAVMTRDPHTLGPDASYGHALALMQEHGFRHVPVIEKGKIVGIVTARNALDPDLEEFISEERRGDFWRRDGGN
jgi:CBS domain-containing protein